MKLWQRRLAAPMIFLGRVPEATRVRGLRFCLRVMARVWAQLVGPGVGNVCCGQCVGICAIFLRGPGHAGAHGRDCRQKSASMTALQGWIVIGLLVLIILGIVGIGAEIEYLPYVWRTYSP